ncbi:hypothetical protein OS242_10695 [Tumebacillus sp. DT12]|uniref:Uncharacterized protein n=1 Tax=Tumebacillus lacus TaxID=2995335 RepID=A0ABT3X1W1_9BACL|nr:hypothetical protein [Tumebacillus lacus]MCX7570431.1 hypothetical protein [Tumebacillus lacus]
MISAKTLERMEAQVEEVTHFVKEFLSKERINTKELLEVAVQVCKPVFSFHYEIVVNCEGNVKRLLTDSLAHKNYDDGHEIDQSELFVTEDGLYIVVTTLSNQQEGDARLVSDPFEVGWAEEEIKHGIEMQIDIALDEINSQIGRLEEQLRVLRGDRSRLNLY